MTRQQQPLKVVVATPPAVEPVCYKELADFVKVPSIGDKATIMALEVVGRRYVEQITRKTLITTVFNFWLDFFPSTILIPGRPVQRVNFIKYTDQDAVVQTLDPSRYLVDQYGPRPNIFPPLSQFFPIAHVQWPNAVQVNFTAGFGDSPAEVPQEYKTLICQWVATNYFQREAVIAGKTAAIVPHTFQALLRLVTLPEV